MERENGKGKEYCYDGKLMFKREYLNGKRWNVKGYNKKDNNIEFEIKKWERVKEKNMIITVK